MGEWLGRLSDLPIWAVGLVALGAMALGAAIGQALRFQRARRRAREFGESAESVAEEGNLHGAVLGTLGLLLAFSFGMVLNRYEERRDLAVREADAIGTAYLRVQILDEPHRTRLSNLLLAYTANKIELSSLSGEGGPSLERNDKLLTEIWAAVSAARGSALATGMTTPLLNAFNDLIDLDSDRKIAWDLRLPAGVLSLLLTYLVITTAVIGYQVNGPRGRRAAVVLFILIALSIAFITNINRPRPGSEPEAQQPLIRVLDTLRSQPPHAFDLFEPAP